MNWTLTLAINYSWMGSIIVVPTVRLRFGAMAAPYALKSTGLALGQ
jgi:hypothetical protein